MKLLVSYSFLLRYRQVESLILGNYKAPKTYAEYLVLQNVVRDNAVMKSAEIMPHDVNVLSWNELED